MLRVEHAESSKPIYEVHKAPYRDDNENGWNERLEKS